MDSVFNPVSNASRRNLFIRYALVAYLISWAIEIPLALKAQGLKSLELPFAIHYLAAFGPFVAALILTWQENGSAGLKELATRAMKWRVEPIWWLVAISPLLLFFILAVVIRLFQGNWLDFRMLGRFDFLPDLGGAAILLWLATYGFGEEVGWRGYLLPRLQRDRSAWSATVILWSIWAIWHVPSFFYLHTATGPGTLVGFLLGLFAGAVFLTWLYNSSGGSVLIVAVWHGLFDYVTACTQCKSGLIAAALSTAVMIGAILIVPILKPRNLSRKEKHVL